METNPLVADTDGDGIPDGLETASSPVLRDTDGDGLTDAEEDAFQLRPNDEDFDGDGLYDGLEMKIGTDPHKADTDNDGATDYAEYFCLMSDPRNPDTDGDGTPDGSDPTPLGKTDYNPARYVSWTFTDLFKREDKVDETSKSFLLLLHLIRSAPREMLLGITIEIYGEDAMTASGRKLNIEAFLKRLTRGWTIPRLTFVATVKANQSLHAGLEYEWNAALR